MGIFDKLSKSRTIRAFVAKTLIGPSDCRIKISDIADLYDALVDDLLKRGVAKPTIIRLLDSKSLGVCPKCYTATRGEWLSGFYVKKLMMQRGTHVIELGRSSDTERFLKGICRNPNCDCKEILIFWRPDEDKGTTDRLAKMGISERHCNELR